MAYLTYLNWDVDRSLNGLGAVAKGDGFPGFPVEGGPQAVGRPKPTRASDDGNRLQKRMAAKLDSGAAAKASAAMKKRRKASSKGFS